MTPAGRGWRTAGIVVWLAVVLAGCAAPSTSYVMLVESPDGSTGKVIVSDASGERVLDRANQVAVLDGSARATVEADPEAAARDFNAARSALPMLPERFVLFFVNRFARMTPESARQIPEIAQRIRARPAAEVTVIGHTDTVGDPGFNERLGMQRARSVVVALVREGVEPVELVVESRGERELAIPTPDETHEPRNRRVEVSVR